MRESVFKNNGTDFGYGRNHKDWITKTKQTVRVVGRTQGRAIEEQMEKSPMLKIVRHAITTIAPKSLTMNLLKMKIHMQTLIGNVFGFQFKALEANITQLDRLKADMEREKKLMRQMRG